MFILQETVLSDMLLRSWDQTLFMIEKILSTGAEVPGKEDTNSVTCLRLVTDRFFSFKYLNISTHFTSDVACVSSQFFFLAESDM